MDEMKRTDKDDIEQVLSSFNPAVDASHAHEVETSRIRVWNNISNIIEKENHTMNETIPNKRFGFLFSRKSLALAMLMIVIFSAFASYALFQYGKDRRNPIAEYFPKTTPTPYTDRYITPTPGSDLPPKIASLQDLAPIAAEQLKKLTGTVSDSDLADLVKNKEIKVDLKKLNKVMYTQNNFFVYEQNPNQKWPTYTDDPSIDMTKPMITEQWVGYRYDKEVVYQGDKVYFMRVRTPEFYLTYDSMQNKNGIRYNYYPASTDDSINSGQEENGYFRLLKILLDPKFRESQNNEMFTFDVKLVQVIEDRNKTTVVIDESIIGSGSPMTEYNIDIYPDRSLKIARISTKLPNGKLQVNVTDLQPPQLIDFEAGIFTDKEFPKNLKPTVINEYMCPGDIYYRENKPCTTSSSITPSPTSTPKIMQ